MCSSDLQTVTFGVHTGSMKFERTTGGRLSKMNYNSGDRFIEYKYNRDDTVAEINDLSAGTKLAALAYEDDGQRSLLFNDDGVDSAYSRRRASSDVVASSYGGFLRDDGDRHRARTSRRAFRSNRASDRTERQSSSGDDTAFGPPLTVGERSTDASTWSSRSSTSAFTMRPS